ncbi:zinc-binding oxidoreductase alcohol dehydrogenase [Scheffersomyces xylosifermentans]|uniref:zinc-binding oxidoreductase alcohol dehydrogenase n=1 Tax=Scheffersomyces xylosifermentans TaxID=1304137 RepID=UPI00315C56D2
MSSIKAAVSTGSKESGKLVTITDIDFPTIEDNQLLFKAVAYAANPTDWKHAVYDLGSPGSIYGTDASGIIVKVGKNVKGFEVGDYVSTFMHGNQSNKRGAFSQYIIADPDTTIKYNKASFNNNPLPVGTTASSKIRTFESAATATLSLGTVAVSFADGLKISEDKEENSQRYILIWGGATATGIYAIQIAKLVYGLKVITTSSPQHHEFLKTLGADEVFDYRSPNVVGSIIESANGEIYYALDTVSTKESYQQTYDSTKGSKKVAFDNLSGVFGNDIVTDPTRTLDTFTATASYLADGRKHHMGATEYVPSEEFLRRYRHFWYDLLPPHIEELKTPNLIVLSSGLESTSEALELLREDKVRGGKVVFRA